MALGQGRGGDVCGSFSAGGSWGNQAGQQQCYVPAAARKIDFASLLHAKNQNVSACSRVILPIRLCLFIDEKAAPGINNVEAVCERLKTLH